MENYFKSDPTLFYVYQIQTVTKSPYTQYETDNKIKLPTNKLRGHNEGRMPRVPSSVFLGQAKL